MAYSGPKIGNWFYADLDFRTGNAAILADGANVVNGISITVRGNAAVVTSGITAGANGLRLATSNLLGSGTAAFSHTGGAPQWGTNPYPNPGTPLGMPNIGIPLAANIPSLARHLNAVGLSDIQLVACFSTASNNLWYPIGTHQWSAGQGIGICDTYDSFGENSLYSLIPFMSAERCYDYDLGCMIRGWQASGDGSSCLGGYGPNIHTTIPRTNDTSHFTADSQALSFTMGPWHQTNPVIKSGTYNGDGVVPSTFPYVLPSNLTKWNSLNYTRMANKIGNLEANFHAWGSGVYLDFWPTNYVGELEKLRVMWR